MSQTRPSPVDASDPDADWSLPAWLYDDPEYFEVESARILRPSWQVVCHLNDIPEVGDYRTLDFLGESIVVVRGEDLQVRAFANVCRHRGARLVDGTGGCAKRLICPYHAWTYELDGRLVGVPLGKTYPTLDKETMGLPPIETEIWRSFIFVRLEGGGPSVAEMMAPYDAEVAPYRFDELQAIGRVTLRHRTVNWKNVADNYSDGLHIRVAHPGLTRLLGASYGVEASPFADKMWGQVGTRASDNPSERLYQHFLPRVDHLPEENQRLWLYYKLWPNVAFDIYPDQIDFMQFLPLTPTTTMIREISYALPDDRREMKAARYLNWRVNRQVNLEDTDLIQRVQDGMASPTFSVGPLSEQEVCLRHFAGRVRELIPEARLHQRPAPGWSRRPRPVS